MGSKNLTKFAITTAFLVISSNLTYAADEGALSFNGNLWTQYGYDLTEKSSHNNGFDISRAQLKASYKLNSTWSGIMGTDVMRSSQLVPYLKMAYIEGNGLWSDGQLKMGYVPSDFISGIDSVTKSRWISKSLTDESNSIYSFMGGATAGGKMAGLKYFATIHNGGERIAKAGASDNGLAFALGVTLMPFSEGPMEKLGISVTEDYSTPGASLSNRMDTNGAATTAAALHFESSIVDFAAEFIFQKNNRTTDKAVGYGWTGNFKLADEGKLGLHTRYFGGDTNFQTYRLLSKNSFGIGPTYAFVPGKVSSALIFEQRGTLVVAGKNNQSLKAVMAFNF